MTEEWVPTLTHLFKWENLHNGCLTKYFFAPLYIETERERDREGERDRDAEKKKNIYIYIYIYIEREREI